MSDSGTKPVLFFGQYGNHDRVELCSVDRFGVWRTPSGNYMPAPKFVVHKQFCGLICAPQFIIEKLVYGK